MYKKKETFLNPASPNLDSQEGAEIDVLINLAPNIDTYPAMYSQGNVQTIPVVHIIKRPSTSMYHQTYKKKQLKPS